MNGRTFFGSNTSLHSALVVFFVTMWIFEMIDHNYGPNVCGCDCMYLIFQEKCVQPNPITLKNGNA